MASKQAKIIQISQLLSTSSDEEVVAFLSEWKSVLDFKSLGSAISSMVIAMKHRLMANDNALNVLVKLCVKTTSRQQKPDQMKTTAQLKSNFFVRLPNDIFNQFGLYLAKLDAINLGICNSTLYYSSQSKSFLVNNNKNHVLSLSFSKLKEILDGKIDIYHWCLGCKSLVFDQRDYFGRKDKKQVLLDKIRKLRWFENLFKSVTKVQIGSFNDTLLILDYIPTKTLFSVQDSNILSNSGLSITLSDVGSSDMEYISRFATNCKPFYTDLDVKDDDVEISIKSDGKEIDINNMNCVATRKIEQISLLDCGYSTQDIIAMFGFVDYKSCYTVCTTQPYDGHIDISSLKNLSNLSGLSRLGFRLIDIKFEILNELVAMVCESNKQIQFNFVKESEKYDQWTIDTFDSVRNINDLVGILHSGLMFGMDFFGATVESKGKNSLLFFNIIGNWLLRLIENGDFAINSSVNGNNIDCNWQPNIETLHIIDQTAELWNNAEEEYSPDPEYTDYNAIEAFLHIMDSPFKLYLLNWKASVRNIELMVHVFDSGWLGEDVEIDDRLSRQTNINVWIEHAGCMLYKIFTQFDKLERLDITLVFNLSTGGDEETKNGLEKCSTCIKKWFHEIVFKWLMLNKSQCGTVLQWLKNRKNLNKIFDISFKVILGNYDDKFDQILDLDMILRNLEKKKIVKTKSEYDVQDVESVDDLLMNFKGNILWMQRNLDKVIKIETDGQLQSENENNGIDIWNKCYFIATRGKIRFVEV